MVPRPAPKADAPVVEAAKKEEEKVLYNTPQNNPTAKWCVHPTSDSRILLCPADAGHFIRLLLAGERC
jgi:hypothetical protein